MDKWDVEKVHWGQPEKGMWIVAASGKLFQLERWYHTPGSGWMVVDTKGTHYKRYRCLPMPRESEDESE